MKKFTEQQLKFDLDLDEVAEEVVEGSISYEEAQKRSQAARVIFENIGAHHGIPVPDWGRDYQRLIEQGWPWRVACYIAWAASPRVGRWPETLQELATQVLGLTSPRAIYIWREKHPTINEVVANMMAAPLFEHRRDVLEALVEMARTPDYKSFNDRKLFLEMIGDYVPRSKLEVGKSQGGDESEMSDEELRSLLGSEPSPLSGSATQSQTFGPLPKKGEGNDEADDAEQPDAD